MTEPLKFLVGEGGSPAGWVRPGADLSVLVTDGHPGDLYDQRADLLEQLDTICRELQAAAADITGYADYCRDAALQLDDWVIGRLLDAVQQAAGRTALQRRQLLDRTSGDPAEQLAAVEAVLRFGLATLAHVRGALEWCSPSYAQSRAAQFFNTDAQGSPTVNYERYENPPLRRVERQLLAVLGLDPDRYGVTATSSGVAAYTLVESFLLRHRLRHGDTVLIAPYIYFEADEQLTSLPFVRFERTAGYGVDDFLAAVRAHRPRVVFADPVANTAQQRMVDLPALIAGLRATATQRTTLVIDGTMLSGGFSPELLAPDGTLEVLYYESGSKYLQLGMDAGMAGVVVFPLELRDHVERLRRNTGSILYRHGAELFPRYGRAFYRRRMRRIGANALRLATLLAADPRVRAAGTVAYPGLPDHPDQRIAAALPYAGGCVTYLHRRAELNTRDALNSLFDIVLANCQPAGVQLTKGASFGFGAPRISAADAFAPGEPPFLRLYAGDRGDQIDALAEALGAALTQYAR